MYSGAINPITNLSNLEPIYPHNDTMGTPKGYIPASLGGTGTSRLPNAGCEGTASVKTLGENLGCRGILTTGGGSDGEPQAAQVVIYEEEEAGEL